MKDYYYILGIARNAQPDEIKTAFRKLSLKFHPDKNENDNFFEGQFKEIKEAYDVLGNPAKRQQYDSAARASAAQQTANNSRIIAPIIDFFVCDKTELEYGEAVTLRWQTRYADRVLIVPLGEFEPNGEKTYKVRNSEHAFINFELIAQNTKLKIQTKRHIQILNNGYDDMELREKKENRTVPPRPYSKPTNYTSASSSTEMMWMVAIAFLIIVGIIILGQL